MKRNIHITSVNDDKNHNKLLMTLWNYANMVTMNGFEWFSFFFLFFWQYVQGTILLELHYSKQFNTLNMLELLRYKYMRIKWLKEIWLIFRNDKLCRLLCRSFYYFPSSIFNLPNKSMKRKKERKKSKVKVFWKALIIFE